MASNKALEWQRQTLKSEIASYQKTEATYGYH